MKKAVLKKVLCIINNTNLQVEQTDLQDAVMNQLAEESIIISEKNVLEILSYVNQIGILYKDNVGYDVTPCGFVFAKANNGSVPEALAFFECFIKNRKTYDDIKSYLLTSKVVPWKRILDSISYDLFHQTALWDQQNNTASILLYPEIISIMKEYQEKSILISGTLSAIYANELVDYKNDNIEYRNQDGSIVEYSNLEYILNIIPRNGIPENRDVTKATQTFYKDMLMNEFHHCCPICGIDIPHMLIASHIKPFRDCAHIFETLDHHNGLLLCRNHDYLFDQGYFSFDDDGKVILSSLLTKKDNLQSVFSLHKHLHLDTEHMEGNRKLFLKYHREHILKK